MNRYLPKDFIYIDIDTIICDSLESIPTDYDVGMVLNRHMKTSESPVKDFFEQNAKRLGWHDGYDDRHFNGGFMSVQGSEKSDALFTLWHELWNESRENQTEQSTTKHLLMKQTTDSMGSLQKLMEYGTVR